MRRPISAWGEVLAEAQVQHELFSLGQSVSQPVDGRGSQDGVETRIFIAEPLTKRRCVALLRLHATVKRIARAGLRRFGGLEEFFERAADLRCELARGRVAPEVSRARSSALMSPIAAICSRSSSRTRLPRSKRRAIELASWRYRLISSSRTRGLRCSA